MDTTCATAGYNAAMTEGNEIKGRFHRRKFARGPWNRIIDWMDWMMPEAWDVEHNHLHHYQLGEDADPDLVERNMKTTREGPMPMWARYMQVAALSVIWKWFYYAAEHDEGVVREKSERGGKERRGIVPTVHDWVDAVHGIDDGPICVPGNLARLLKPPSASRRTRRFSLASCRRLVTPSAARKWPWPLWRRLYWRICSPTCTRSS